jgi:hypothetical protein
MLAVASSGGSVRHMMVSNSGTEVQTVDLTLPTEKLYLLEERLTFDDIRQRAADRRLQAFAGGLGGMFQRPKPEEVALVASQRRLEPFWHVSGKSRYVYDRTRGYTVPASGVEVQAVTVNGNDYAITAQGPARAFSMPVVEHCIEEFRSEKFLDARSGAPVTDGPQVLAGPKSEIASPDELAVNETVVVPPEQRASFVVRQVIGELLRPIQADQLLEESVALENADLYYRPVYAFEYSWTPRGKSAVVEIDAATGNVRQAPSLFHEVKGVFSHKDAWFDITADTVGMLVPGANIAMKVGKVVVQHQQNKTS